MQYYTEYHVIKIKKKLFPQSLVIHQTATRSTGMFFCLM